MRIHVTAPRRPERRIAMTNLISRYDPFRDVAGLSAEVDRLFRDAIGGTRAPATAGAFAPALDVEETEDGFTLFVELPGVAPENVDLTLEENVLTISGERAFYDERTAESFRRVERSFGRFHRAIRLPDRVNGAGVEADYHDGLLTIRVPKAEEAKPRRIEVRAS
jgi:HSP20 family protein